MNEFKKIYVRQEKKYFSERLTEGKSKQQIEFIAQLKTDFLLKTNFKEYY